jgi:hypothetical protein
MQHHALMAEMLEDHVFTHLADAVKPSPDFPGSAP